MIPVGSQDGVSLSLTCARMERQDGVSLSDVCTDGEAERGHERLLINRKQLGEQPVRCETSVAFKLGPVSI